MAPLDEFALIRAWTEGRQTREFLEAQGVALGIGDDAAVVNAEPGEQWLLAADTMTELVHFRSETMEDEDVGYKALASNVSDIAAMGGRPKFALVSVSVPPHWDPARMKRLYDGLYECAKRYGIAVVGGDTTSAPAHLVVSVTLIGAIESGKAISRGGAKPGQFVFLTGATGLSAGGLHGMLAEKTAGRIVPAPPARLTEAHRRPSPSVKAGTMLSARGWATSLNDVSDGLANEAWEIAEASNAKLVLTETSLPRSGEMVRYAGSCGVDPLEWMLYGGEDYVLLGTADRSREAEMKAEFRAEGIPFFVVGEVREGKPEAALETASGKLAPIPKRGYNHFSKG